MHGAKVVEGVRVAGVTRDARGTAVTGVVTEGGRTIRAKKVVNCAGMWARQLAEQAGVVCPNQAAEHYYLVTDAMPEVCASAVIARRLIGHLLPCLFLLACALVCAFRCLQPKHIALQAFEKCVN